jgi:nucleoside-diphosphate-sugar epimerase
MLLTKLLVFMKNRIVLTGSSGFVGKNLIQYLDRNGFNVAKINRDEINNLHFDEFDKCANVIHLVGKAHDLRKPSDSSEYYKVNYEITRRLYDAFLKSKAKRFIFMSSVKAVADTVDGVLTEDIVPNPQTHYGKSKLMAEEYIRNQILPEGKSYYILRPCMIHGPGNKGNLNLLYKVVKSGIPYPLGAFHNLRSFLSIANLNFVIQEIILGLSIPSGVYNLADDDALSTNQVIEIISNDNGGKTRLWNINPEIIKKLAVIGDKLHLPLNSERLKKLTESYVVSNNKIKKALNVKCLPISSKEGLSTTIQSFHSS